MRRCLMLKSNFSCIRKKTLVKFINNTIEFWKKSYGKTQKLSNIVLRKGLYGHDVMIQKRLETSFNERAVQRIRPNIMTLCVG